MTPARACPGVQRFAAGTATFRSRAYGAEAASVEWSRRAGSGSRDFFVPSGGSE